MKEFFANLVELLYPSRCLFCGEYIEPLQNLCSDCLKYRSHNICHFCGVEYSNCKCSFKFNALYSPFLYSEKAKAAIISIKARGDVPLTRFFAKEISSLFCEYESKQSYDYIVPVPASKKSMRNKGFNQTELLASEIKKHLKIPVNKQLLSRTEDSSKQHELDHEQRAINAHHSYFIKANAESLAGKNVILVDDVATTGATLDRCSGLLSKLGAVRVVALSATVVRYKKDVF